MMHPTFVPDEPGSLSAEDDLFGHRDYAAMLERAVLAAPTRFTFGLFGDWGLGKSTILQALRERLAERRDCTFVGFDAWRYENDALRREFLRELATQLHASGAFGRWKADRELSVLDEDVASSRERELTLSWRQLVVGLVGVCTLAAVYLLVHGAVDDPDGSALTLVLLMPLIVFLAARAERLLRVREENVTRRRLEDPDRFAAAFRKLIRQVGNRERIVIAVDNLDRCTPETAADLLGTIKTYLEPELRELEDAPAVVFVIAVDDRALRRHLMTLAPERPGVEGRARENDARQYADEYLRKFFNASTSLRPLRTGDVSEYIRRQVEGVVARLVDPASWEPDPRLGAVPPPAGQAEQIVEMATAAFRRSPRRVNPRRVKQFVNNFELQMSLIREREEGATPKIVPRISPHFALVAKLVLLEEEWPDRFDQLRQDEELLSRWHEAARKQEVPDGWDESEWLGFAPFLRSSRDVRPERLTAFLRLKLTEKEAQLPRFSDFRDAVVSGDFANVESLLTAPDVAARKRSYAEHLPQVLNEEVYRGRIQGAVNVVDTLLSVDALRSDVEARTKTLTLALSDPRLDRGLANVRADALVEAAGSLSDDDRAKLLGLLAAQLGSGGAGRDAEVVSALAEVARAFPDAVKEQIRGAIASEHVAGRHVLYLPLAYADPNLLPREAVDRALAVARSIADLHGREYLVAEVAAAGALAARAEAARPERSPQNSPAPPVPRRRSLLPATLPQESPPAPSEQAAAVEVLRLAFLRAPEGELLQAVVDLLASWLELAGDHLDAAATVAEYVDRWRGGLAEAAEDDVRRLVDALRANLEAGTARSDTQGAYARRCLHAAGRLADVRLPLHEVGEDLVEAARLAPRDLTAYALEHRDEIPRELRLPVARRLVELLDRRDGADDAREALGALARERLVLDASPEDVAAAANDWLDSEGGAPWWLDPDRTVDGVAAEAPLLFTSICELKPLYGSRAADAADRYLARGSTCDADGRAFGDVAVMLTARLRRDSDNRVLVEVERVAPTGAHPLDELLNVAEAT